MSTYLFMYCIYLTLIICWTLINDVKHRLYFFGLAVQQQLKCHVLGTVLEGRPSLSEKTRGQSVKAELSSRKAAQRIGRVSPARREQGAFLIRRCGICKDWGEAYGILGKCKRLRMMKAFGRKEGWLKMRLAMKAGPSYESPGR